jgi:hypothetical protein
MIDFDVVVYAMLGVSVSASAVQIGRWLLSANPRAIINAGRWSLAGLVVLTPLVLLWLVMSGRATLAMMLAAFVLPVFVQGGLRWRTLFGPLNLIRATAPDWPQDLGADIVSGRPVMRDPTDPNVVRQAVIALSAYVEHAARYDHRSVADTHFGARLANGSENGSGRSRMSVQEALDILELDSAAGSLKIREAHRRLEERVKPELGDTHYLALKINEARDVLLEHAEGN